MGAIARSGIWNQFFDDLMEPVSEQTSGNHIPDVSIQKSEDAYRVVVHLPGIKKENLSINVEDGHLKISGTYTEEASEDFETVHQEYFRYVKFSRRLKLDTKRFKVDQIDAKLADGVLIVDLPLAEEVKPKQIEVRLTEREAIH